MNDIAELRARLTPLRNIRDPQLRRMRPRVPQSQPAGNVSTGSGARRVRASRPLLLRPPSPSVKRRRKRRSFRARVTWLGIALALAGLTALGVWELFFLRLGELRDSRSVRTIRVPALKGSRDLVVGPTNPYWTPLGAVSSTLVLCVVRAEDAKFFQHDGFDWERMQEAFETNLEEGKYHRGGSTITMQLAKNLFLWRSKSIVRKVLEALPHVADRARARQEANPRALPERRRVGAGNLRHRRGEPALFLQAAVGAHARRIGDARRHVAKPDPLEPTALAAARDAPPARALVATAARERARQ